VQGRVTALVAAGNTWFVATEQGVFRSTNDGASWDGPVLGGPHAATFQGLGTVTTLVVSGEKIYAARRQGMLVSADQGATWQPVIYPAGITAIAAMAVTPDGMLWVGGREGVLYTADNGHTWGRMKQLPVVDINSLAWDASMSRMILTSRQSTVIFAIEPGDKTWKWWDAGWPVRSVASVGGRLVAASMFSGVVAGPQPETASAGGGVNSAQR
jgi:photosystem II stability/assembly factor-like uncharacterized protein